MYKFENEVELKVISGETGKVVYEWKDPNAISDDFVVGGEVGGRIYEHGYIPPSTGSTPYCFLLPDDPIGLTNWTSGMWAAQGSVFDRQNPWAPYCTSVNNSVDTSAEPNWKLATSTTFLAPDNTTVLSYPTGIAGRWRLFYQWGTSGGLPGLGLQLKALGLTAWENDIVDQQYGAGSTTNMQPTIFVPQTLVVLPTSVFIHGRNGGAGTPDILQVSYFLSIVGAS
jgi:hypothetical protein